MLNYSRTDDHGSFYSYQGECLLQGNDDDHHEWTSHDVSIASIFMGEKHWRNNTVSSACYFMSLAWWLTSKINASKQALKLSSNSKVAPCIVLWVFLKCTESCKNQLNSNAEINCKVNCCHIGLIRLIDLTIILILLLLLLLSFPLHQAISSIKSLYFAHKLSWLWRYSCFKTFKFLPS